LKNLRRSSSGERERERSTRRLVLLAVKGRPVEGKKPLGVIRKVVRMRTGLKVKEKIGYNNLIDSFCFEKEGLRDEEKKASPCFYALRAFEGKPMY